MKSAKEMNVNNKVIKAAIEAAKVEAAKEPEVKEGGKPELNIAKIIVGNHYDSRMPGTVYAGWTSGYDVRIENNAGACQYYQLRNFNKNVVSKIPPVEILNATEVAWDDLPSDVRRKYITEVYPNASKKIQNILVYGEEKGDEINALLEWAQAHIIYSREITLQLMGELGCFEQAEFIGRVARRSIYLIDKRWQVTVGADGYTVADYDIIANEKRAFGRRVAHLAKRAEVPWGVAKVVGHITDDKEAIDLLKQIKALRGVPNELVNELRCGIGRRTAALAKVLGPIWAQIDCKGQGPTTTLARYLIEG